jgi:translocation and assembly module TamB
MRRRYLAWFAIGVCWLGGTVLGLGAAAFRTDTGRRLVVQFAERVVNDNLRGTLTIGSVGGSFLRGLEVEDVTLVGEDGVLFATIDRVGLRYRLGDLLSGRIVLGQLTLTGPRVNLVQWARDEKLNADVILSGSGEGGDGPRPLIAFNDAVVVDGEVMIRTPERRGNRGVIEGEEGPRGYLRVRRVTGINGRFPYVRISSPLPSDGAIRIEIDRLRAEASDPVMSVTGALGVAEILGDSLALDLSRMRLPRSDASLEGALTWFTGPLLPDLTIGARRIVSDEVLGIVRDLPAGLAGSGTIVVRSPYRGLLEFDADDLDLVGLNGRGRARGRVGAVLGPGEEWALVAMDLQVENFDLEFTRTVFDTLPIQGRVTGRVTGNGPREDLLLGMDAHFRDSLVDGWPESYVRGEGIVAVGVPGDFVFEEFVLDTTDIELGTVRRLIPAIDLVGRLRGSGELNGAWLNPTYEGVLRYADEPLPETVAWGTVELDARGDTLGVWGELTFDSLHLASFHSSYPGFGLSGAFSGPVVLDGWLDSLRLDAELEGPPGRVDARTAIELLPERRGAHRIEAAITDIDVQQFDTTLPATRLTGTVTGSARDEFDGNAELALHAALGGSVVSGTFIDSTRAAIVIENRLIRVDTLEVTAAGLEIAAQGGVGLEDPRRGVLVFTAMSDSLGVLEPTFETWLGALEAGEPLPRGRARIVGRVEGSLDRYQITAQLDDANLQRRDLYAAGLYASVSYESEDRAIRIEGAADSVSFNGFEFVDLVAAAEGRTDSVSWLSRGVFGQYDAGSWIGWGMLRRDSTRYEVAIDTLGVLLAGGPWFVDSAAVVVDDSGVDLSRVAFDRPGGAGSVSVEGRFPLRGAGQLTGSIDALPVRDLWLLFQRNFETVAGELGGTFRLAGTAEEPTLRMDGNLADGVFGEFRPPYTSLVIEYGDQRLTGEAQLVRLGERIMDVEVDVPVDLAIVGARRRRLPGPISIRAFADSVDLALLEATMPSVQEIGGTLDAEFGIAGTWDQPELTGRVSVQNGAATFPALGVRHEQLNGTLLLSGDTIAVREFTVASDGGSAEVLGFVRLDELSKPILDLQVIAQDFNAINVADFLELTASGNISLRGPLFAATLSGQSQATRGVLYFADLIRKDIVNLEDTLFAEFVDTLEVQRHGLGRPFENRFLDSLFIDSVRVDMGANMWLRSSEADVQLEGAVYLTHSRGQYRFDGTLQAPRGRYNLQLGLMQGVGALREFRVTRGQVRYLGTPDLNADLDIDAEHKVNTVRNEELTVFVNIGGTLYEPSLTLTSDSPTQLSETEILSYLLVGAPSVQAGTETTGFQSWLLWQQAFGAVSSQLEYALISDVGIPLDYIQISPETGQTGGLAGAELALGKRFEVFGTTAFLRASPRFCQSNPQPLDIGASLEFRLTQRWLVAASVDPLRSCESLTNTIAQRYQFGLDFLWEKRY